MISGCLATREKVKKEKKIFKKAAVSLLFLLAVFFVFGKVNLAQAAIITWDGGGTSNNWSDCVNWNGDTCPAASGDSVVFNATSVKNCTIDTSISVNIFTISATYSGTITQANLVSINTTFNQLAGTWQGGGSLDNFTVSASGIGVFTISSGATYIATAGITYVYGNFTIAEGAGANAFQHNNGTVSFASARVLEQTVDLDSTNSESGGTETFYNVNIAAQGTDGTNGVFTLTAGGTPVILNNLVFSEGSSTSTGPIYAQGNVTVNSTWDGGTLPLCFSGGNNQTFSSDLTNPIQYAGSIDINKTAGTVSLGSNLTQTVNPQSLTITAGALDISGYNLSKGSFDSGWTFTLKNGGTLAYQGGETMNFAGPPDFQNGSTFKIYGVTSQTFNINAGGLSQYNVIIGDSARAQNTHFVLVSSNLNVLGDLTIDATASLDLSGLGVTVVGNFTNNGTVYLQGGEATSLGHTLISGSSSSVYYNGTGNYSSLKLGSNYQNLYFNSAGAWKQTTPIDVDGVLSLTNGATLNSDSQDVTLAGNFFVCTTCAYTSGANTFTFNGASQSINDKNNVVSLSFNNLVKNVTSPADFTWGAGSTITVVGTTTLTGSSRTNYLNLITDNNGQQVNFNPQGSRTIQYARVRDNKNTNATVIALAVGNVNSGNNTNWNFAGITITQSNGNITVRESGVTDSFFVYIDTQPANDVVITITPDAQTTTSPTSLTFPSTWNGWSNGYQDVRVTAVSDGVTEGNHTSTIAFSVASVDLDYDGLSIASIIANVMDPGGGGGVVVPPIVPPVLPPSPPTNLTATEITATSIKWCFDNNASSATVFYLYNQSQEEITRLSVPGGQASGTNVCLNEENLASNQTLNTNTRYVKAFNAQGLSDLSAPAAAVTTLAAIPGAPLLTAIDKYKAKLILATDQNSTPTEYAIWEKTTDKWVSGPGVLGTTPAWLTRTNLGNESGLIINGLTTGVTYEFKVKARNANNIETDFSNSSLIKPLANPPDLSIILSAEIHQKMVAYPPLSTTSKTVDIAMLSFLGIFTLLTIRIPRKALFLFSHPHKSFTKIAKRDEQGQWLSSYVRFKTRHRLSRLAFWGTLFSALVKLLIIACFVSLGINPLFAKAATPIKAGDVIELTAKIKNQGTGPATEVKMSSNIPAGFVYISGPLPAGAINNVLQVDLGAINPNEEKTVQWTGEVAEQAAVLGFSASVQAKELAQVVSSNTLDFSTAAPEICDGKDNNGDGVIDEDFPEKGQTCTIGVGACQSQGEKICQKGKVKCNAAAKLPSQEICDDGLDNDCDGAVDLQDNDCKNQEQGEEDKEGGQGEGEQGTGEQGTGGQEQGQEQGQTVTGGSGAPLPEFFKVSVEAVQPVFAAIFNTKNVEEAVSKTVKVVNQNVYQNSIVQKTNIQYAAPALVAAAAANVGIAIPALNLLSYLQLLLQYLQTLIFQPILLFSRKKRKAWGVAYNALSKMPVDLATIRLVEAQTNRLLQTKVTDRDGRYVFLVGQPGQVRLEAIKAGHIFPSQYLKNKATDLDLADLYHGEAMTINKKGDILTRNIPLDPEEKIVPPELIIKKKRRARLQSSLALTGFGFACVSFAVSPTYLIGGLLVTHIFFYGLFRRLSLGRKPKGYGTVIDIKTKKPLAYAVVRIFENQYNKLLETQITDNKGRYSFLVGKGQYYLTFEKPGYEPLKSSVIDKTLPQAKGKEGFVGERVEVRKA